MCCNIFFLGHHFFLGHSLRQLGNWHHGNTCADLLECCMWAAHELLLTSTHSFLLSRYIIIYFISLYLICFMLWERWPIVERHSWECCMWAVQRLLLTSTRPDGPCSLSLPNAQEWNQWKRIHYRDFCVFQLCSALERYWVCFHR